MDNRVRVNRLDQTEYIIQRQSSQYLCYRKFVYSYYICKYFTCTYQKGKDNLYFRLNQIEERVYPSIKNKDCGKNEIHSNEDPDIFIKRLGLSSIPLNQTYGKFRLFTSRLINCLESEKEEINENMKEKDIGVGIPRLKLMDKVVGKWKQVKTVGMDQFLKKENGPWIFQKFAAIAMPDFQYKKIDDK